MNPLAALKSWLSKRKVPLPPARQLEELVKRTAMAGHSKQKPKYYSHAGGYADSKDFDTERMVEDLAAAFPTIPKDEVRRVVMHGIYYWYMR
jgi:hypothetical protein